MCRCCIITYHKNLSSSDFIDSDRDNHHHYPCSVLFSLEQQNDFKFYTPIFFKSNFEVIIMENYKVNKMDQLHFWLTLVREAKTSYSELLFSYLPYSLIIDQYYRNVCKSSALNIVYNHSGNVMQALYTRLVLNDIWKTFFSECELTYVTELFSWVLLCQSSRAKVINTTMCMD